MRQFTEFFRQESMGGTKFCFLTGMKFLAFAVLAIVCVGIFYTSTESALVIMATTPMLTLAKYAKKEDDLSDEEKELIGTIEARMNEALEKFSGGTITRDEFKKAINDIKKLIDDAKGNGASEEVQKELKDLKTMMKDASREIQEMKDKGFSFGNNSPLEKAFDQMFDSQKFKDFTNGVEKKSGKISLQLKDIVSLAGNYTGSTLISRQTNRLVEPLAERKINLRDIMEIEQGDPLFPSITYMQVEKLDRGAATVSENGRLPKSSFSLEEKSESTKRIGTYLQLSKRLLKSRVFVKSWLLNRLPKWIRMAEDFQIMFGDGQGDNLSGIARRAVCVSKWISDVVVTGVAGDVSAVESYNEGKQVKITFSKPFDKIAEGMKITFAGAPQVNSAANPLHTATLLHKVSDRSIVIDTAYNGILPSSPTALTTAQVSALTFTVKNNFFNEVVDPDSGDVVNAIFSLLTYAEYSPNCIVLNPSTIFEIQTAKDTTGRNLGLVVVGADGVKRVGGRPVVESTAIAPGYYFAGDVATAASLVDYTNLEIEFAEDVECKISGYVVAIAQEEVIMPVYNPFAFAHGKLSDVKTAITKA